MMNFNCAACKYEFEEEWEGGERVMVKGDEKPKQVFLSNSIRFFIYNPKPFSDNEEVTLWMCPKCNTIKGEI